MKKVNSKRLLTTVFAALLINTAAIGTSFATSLASLKGTWVITLGGVTGSGDTAYYVTATLDNNGSDGTAVPNATVIATSSGDGRADNNKEIFSITAASWDKKKRTADATLTCNNNVGCGFPLKIQVAKSGQMFNVFFTSGSGSQRLVGTGVKQ